MNKNIETYKNDYNFIKKNILKFWPWLIFLCLVLIFLSSSEIWKRELIDFDDLTFIGPLFNTTLSDYFFNWMPGSNHYAYPIRDLTYYLDIALKSHFGISTFWAQNVLYFFLTRLIWLSILKDYFSEKIGFFIIISLMICFHPVNIEIIEWASNRKHLLVSLFSSIGVLKVISLNSKKETPSNRDWAVLLLLNLFAWLSWPSGALWIFWALYLFRQSLLKKHLYVLVIALTMTLLGLYISSTANSDFKFQTSAVENGLFKMINFGLQGIGRGTINLLFPHHLTPYYQIGHFKNYVGPLIFVGALFFLFKLYKKIGDDKVKENICSFLVLSVFLFLPQMSMVTTFYDFVWSDRYLFLALPPLFIAIFLIARENLKSKISLRIFYGFNAILLFIFAIQYPEQLKKWQGHVSLFEHCALNEKAPKCIENIVEKKFDLTGCLELKQYFDISKELFKKSDWNYDFVFRAEIPFYESFCIVQDELPNFEIKKSKIQELKQLYPQPYYMVFNEINMALKANEINLAYQYAQETYLSNKLIPEASPKLINLFRGQVSALCLVAKEKKSHHFKCEELKKLFDSKTGHIPLNNGQIMWGERVTVFSAFPRAY